MILKTKSLIRLSCLFFPFLLIFFHTESAPSIRSRSGMEGRGFPHKPSLAVLYFENRTGEEDLEHWRYGLSEWFIMDLIQSRHIHVLDGNRIHEALTEFDLLDKRNYSREDLVKIADRFKVSHILYGACFNYGGSIVVTAELWDSHQGKTIRSFKRGGMAEEAFPSLVDEWNREVKAALNLTRDQIDGDFDKDVAVITTSMAEAYRYYMEGCLLRHKGLYREAVSAFKKALDIDPEFAMAYWKMGMAFPRQRLSSYSKKAGALRKAMDRPERLSVRAHYWIQGDFHSMTRYRYGGALEAYRNLLGLYRDDDRGRQGLGLVYFDIEEWEKAASEFRVLIEAGHDNPALYRNLARAYMNPGLYDDARGVLESYLGSVGDDVNIYLALATNYRYHGKYEKAHRVVDEAISLFPDTASCYSGKGDIFLYEGEIGKAEAQYRMLMKSENPAFHELGLFRLAELYLLRGRFRDSRVLAEQGLARARERGAAGLVRDRLSFSAWLDFLTGRFPESLKKLDALWESTLEDEELEWQRFVVYMQGLVCAGRGDLDLALTKAEQLNGLIDRGLDKKKQRLYLHLMGVIELEKKNYRRAIGYLEQSLPMICIRSRLNMAVADSLASAYFESGDLDRARKQYERMAAFPRGRQFYGHVYARRFYRMGEIFEKRGQKNKAIEHYRRFLDIWKDADSGLEEVEHSRKSLAGLRER